MQHQIGVLPSQDIQKMIDSKTIISKSKVPEGNVQPGSLDIRMGKGEIIRLPGIFSLEVDDIAAYSRQICDEANLYHTAITERGFVLETGVPYLIPCEESLDLSEHICGRTNPKSTAGRNNLQVRMVCNGHAEFDSIPPGYKGPLYNIIKANSYPIRIETGQTFNQVRFSNGRMADCQLMPHQLELEHKQHGLLFDLKGKKIPTKDLRIAGSSLVLTANLKNIKKGKPAVFRAKNSNQNCLSYADKGIPLENFFEEVKPSKDGLIRLSKGGFYILSSNEAVAVPHHLCCEMVDYHSGIGEFRSHYAGFFDPSWGCNPTIHQILGTPAVLEIIPHEDLMLWHGSPVCCMEYYNMTELPTFKYGDVGNNYHLQSGPRTAKQFSVSLNSN